MSFSEDDLSDFATDQSEISSDNAVRRSGSDLDELVSRLNFISLSNANNAMARPEITKNHIDLIPVYEGDPNTLSMYIGACEYLAQAFGNADDPTDIVNGYLLRIFQAKLAGRALQLVGSREVIESWCELKDLLQQNFCDQRSERCLVQDLMQIRPDKGETAYNFGIRCKNLLNLILTKVKLAENDINRRRIKMELHNDTVLQAYLRGIVQFGEIGHRVRFRNPANIEIAMSYVLEEENFNYFAKQPNNIQNIEFKPMKQQAPLRQNSFSSINKPSVQNFANPNRIIPQVSQRQYYPTQQYFRQPMMSQTPSPSFKHSPQVRPQWPQQTQGRFHVPQISKPPTFNFAKSPGQLEQRRQPRPTPMEVGTITARTQKPTSFQFRSTGKPNWISEELYHQTDDDNLYYEKEHQEEYQYPTEEVQYYEEDLQHLEQTSYDEEEKFYYTGLEEQSGMTKEETYECIKLNANASSKLPHILLPEINAKFLVDTGSSRSMVSTEKVKEYFYDYVLHEPFTIQTAHATTEHDYVINIPCLKTFKAPNEILKFHVFDFSENYDGLIGVNLMKQLGAVIDVPNGIMRTKFGEIKIHWENSKIKIGPRERKIVRIPVTKNYANIIINHQVIAPGVEIPTFIANTKDFFAITEIANFNNHPVEIEIEKPIPAEIYRVESETINRQIPYNARQVEQMQIENVLNKLRLHHLNAEEADAIEGICLHYKDICYDDRLPLTFTNSVKHRLNMNDETPIYLRPYRKSPQQKEEIKKQVKKLIEQDVIQESCSPWSAPVSIVPKKMDASGKVKYRMVIDYRRLNEQTIDDKYPIPNITEILDKLGRSQYYTTLDLASGYHQIEMDLRDVEKTAFSTEQGHYEYKRMPFGLKNAPATFQRMMDNVLRGLQEDVCHVYLDDIIIYSTSLQEHLMKLAKVFERLREVNLKIQLDKCEFLNKEVAYLGHVITKDGVLPNPDKIEAIRRYPIPKTTTEIKSFLGLIGYYRKFIRDLAKLTKPLTKCLKKGAKIVMGEDYKKAFETCRDILMDAPILQYPDFQKTFILTTDASNVALGAVLSQGKLGSDKPVSYASRTLSETEQRYSTTEKELLAIVWATKYFRPYLYGRRFTIYTDHRPLVWLSSLKEPNSRLARWKIRLDEFNFDIVYKKGKYNTNADALSRIKINAIETESMANNVEDNTEELLQDIREFLDEQAGNLPQIPQETIDEIVAANEDTDTAPEAELEELRETAHSNENEEPTQSIPSMDEAIDSRSPQYHFRYTQLDKLKVEFNQNQGKKIYLVQVPKENNAQQLFQFIREYMDRGKHYLYFEKEQLYKDLCNVYITHFNNNGPKLFRCLRKLQTIENEEEQLEIIKNYHEGKTNHRGINETVKHLQRRYYWMNMKNTIAAYIKRCEMCNRSKYDRQVPHPELNVTEKVDQPFQKINMDTFVAGGKMYLTCVDAFTKFAQAVPIRSKNAVELAEAIITYFSMYGVPEQIIMDGGTEFTNELVRELLDRHKISTHITTPYNPNSNSNIERVHSTLSEHIRLLREKEPNEDVGKLMKLAIIAYNNTIHSTTGLTPLELTLGHTKSRDPFDICYDRTFYNNYLTRHINRLKLLYGKLGEEIQEKKAEIIQKRNTKLKTRPLQEGQEVYVKKPVGYKSKVTPRYSGPYEVKRVFENGTAIVIDKNKRERKVHVRNLKYGIVPDSSLVSVSEDQPGMSK